MPDQAVCPNSEQLRRYALGQLAPFEIESFARHLEQCAGCAAVLEKFLQSSQLASAVRAPDDDKLGPVTEAAPSPLTHSAPVPGDGCIGPYKLLQRLGEGGMGTVWVAEQTQPVKRRVALKVIKAGMDSTQ